MKTVFIVSRYRKHEDVEVYKVFENWVSAVECCKLHLLDTDGYSYYWDEWEVR